MILQMLLVKKDPTNRTRQSSPALRAYGFDSIVQGAVYSVSGLIAPIGPDTCGRFHLHGFERRCRNQYHVAIQARDTRTGPHCLIHVARSSTMETLHLYTCRREDVRGQCFTVCKYAQKSTWRGRLVGVDFAARTIKRLNLTGPAYIVAMIRLQLTLLNPVIMHRTYSPWFAWLVIM